ncbi:MAG: glucosaminidase domain-containing protein [Enterococcus faecalis]
MWQFLTKNNEDEEYEKMPDFENEQSMKAQPTVTEEASFDDEVVYAKEQAAKVKQVQQQVPTELSEESFSFVEKLEEENQLYQQSIKKLTEQLLMQTNEVEALQKQVVEKDVQLKHVKETLSDKETTITSLQKQLSEEKMQQRQTSEENLDTAVTLSQKEIGEVLLEAKRQAKETISQANASTSEFIRKIGEEARVIGQRQDLYASVMIAQAILESGSGNSALAAPPNYNLFGIKGAYQGQSVSFSTQEDDGKGKMTTIHADFRQYPSYKESLTDYSKLIINGLAGNPTFYHGVLKANTTNYQQATKFLTGRYATDTYYDKKLNALIETYQLTEYDQEKKKPVVTNLAEEKKPSFDKEAVKEQLKKEAVIYEVSKGDSLATISQTFGVSATAILKQNSKTQEMFYIGQKITIPQHTAATSLEPKEQALLQSLIISKSVTNALKTAEQSNGKANDSKTESTEYYEVKRGETLAKIAKKTGYSLTALKQTNDLTYSVLTEGQTIALPKLKD